MSFLQFVKWCGLMAYMSVKWYHDPRDKDKPGGWYS